jgi:hypothetical protein
VLPLLLVWACYYTALRMHAIICESVCLHSDTPSHKLKHSKHHSNRRSKDKHTNSKQTVEHSTDSRSIYSAFAQVVVVLEVAAVGIWRVMYIVSVSVCV